MLTVQNYREEIVNSVLNNRVTIVTAETGSGKSTQIPQYLTKYFKQIIVTEPRRMAAKTLAIRVSEEMGTKLGEEVGYRTAYDRCASPESKIVYCTDGLQLVRSLLGSDDTRSILLVIDDLNAQSARMIVEAEKLGVTEDVIKIASIVEIGGLLLKNQRYFCYTSESRSDLLAELDVWNKVNSQEEFDFEKGGINKKNFFKIKEHIQLVMKAIDGIVTLNSSGSREDVLKACLSGLATHIYSRHWNCFVDNNWDERKLDRKSCVEMFSSDFLIGIPKTIEFKNRFGYLSKMDLITFATAVDGDTALEIVPKSYISKEIVEEYSENEDAVVKRVITKVLDKAVKEERIVDYDNPRYDSLKRQYEEMKKWRESWMGREAFEQSYNSNKLSRQEEVRVNGKLYSVNYESGEPYITIYNSGELFEINDENITLHDGTVVTVKCAGKSSKSVSSLKKMVKEYVSVIVRKKNRDRLNAKVVNSIQNIDSVKGELGKLTFNGIIFGYSGINVEGYGCLKVRKDGQIVLDIVSDEEMAKAQTDEALKNLAMKKLKKDYVDSKFSHQTGKKKKVLTSKEETVREDF